MRYCVNRFLGIGSQRYHMLYGLNSSIGWRAIRKSPCCPLTLAASSPARGIRRTLRQADSNNKEWRSSVLQILHKIRRERNADPANVVVTFVFGTTGIRCRLDADDQEAQCVICCIQLLHLREAVRIDTTQRSVDAVKYVMVGQTLSSICVSCCPQLPGDFYIADWIVDNWIFICWFF